MLLNNNNTQNKLIYVNGLSFLSFTDSLVDFQDYEIFSQIKIFEKFQYPELLNKESFINLIEVVNDVSYILKSEEF